MLQPYRADGVDAQGEDEGQVDRDGHYCANNCPLFRNEEQQHYLLRCYLCTHDKKGDEALTPVDIKATRRKMEA